VLRNRSRTEALSLVVMAGLVPAIHVDIARRAVPQEIRLVRSAFAGNRVSVMPTWMAGTSPAMTKEGGAGSPSIDAMTLSTIIRRLRRFFGEASSS